MKPAITFEVYTAKDGVRWRARHRNGNILADSGEAYSTSAGCRNALGDFLHDARHARCEIVERIKKLPNKAPQGEGEIMDAVNEG